MNKDSFRWEIAHVASGSDAAKIKTHVCVWRSDWWDPNLPLSAEWRLLSSQAAVPRHKAGRQQWASPSALGRFEESRCPSWNGVFNVSLGCLQNGNAFVFASTKWANAKCPCHPHPRVHQYQTHIKDPCYSTHCKSNTVRFKSYLLNSIPYTEVAPSRHPAKLWWRRYLWGPLPSGATIKLIYLYSAWMGHDADPDSPWSSLNKAHLPKRNWKNNLSWDKIILEQIHFGQKPKHRQRQAANIKHMT